MKRPKKLRPAAGAEPVEQAVHQVLVEAAGFDLPPALEGRDVPDPPQAPVDTAIFTPVPDSKHRPRKRRLKHASSPASLVLAQPIGLEAQPGELVSLGFEIRLGGPNTGVRHEEET
jgi:hypothetical protein